MGFGEYGSYSYVGVRTLFLLFKGANFKKFGDIKEDDVNFLMFEFPIIKGEGPELRICGAEGLTSISVRTELVSVSEKICC